MRTRPRTRVDEDAGTDAVEDAANDKRHVAVAVVRRLQAEPDSNGNRRRQPVAGAQEPGHEAQAPGEGDRRHPGADAEALKRLVEDKHGVERGKLLPCRAEVEPDDDRVENDAKLEDKKGGNLGLKGALLCALQHLFADGRLGMLAPLGLWVRVGGGGDVARRGRGLVALLALGRGEDVGGVDGAELALRRHAARDVALHVGHLVEVVQELVVEAVRVGALCALGDEAFDVDVPVRHAVLGLDVALGGQVHAEDDDDGGEADGWGPGVGGPAARHACERVHVSLRVVSLSSRTVPYRRRSVDLSRCMRGRAG